MIQTEWPLIHLDASLDAMNNLSSKLCLLKEKVKSWTKVESQKKKDKSVYLEEEISTLLRSSPSAILNDEHQCRLSSLKTDLQKLLDHELYSTRLQSRVTWALNGDANTKYFHAVALAHKNHNAIWSLQDEEGTWISDDQSIKALGVRYFKNIFANDHLKNLSAQLKVIRLFPSYVSGERKKTFTCSVTLLEVERALKTFKRDKALGPDGWPVEFYLSFFDLLGPLLVNMVESSRLLGSVAPP